MAALFFELEEELSVMQGRRRCDLRTVLAEGIAAFESHVLVASSRRH